MSNKRSNYLSRVPEERRKWPRRQTSIVVRVVFMARGVRQLVGVQATVVNLSEGGAALISSKLDLIPEHFYIAFGKLEILLTCSRVRISNDVMHIRFAKDQPTPFIEMLAEIRFPLALLAPIAGSDYQGLLRYAEDVVIRNG